MQRLSRDMSFNLPCVLFKLRLQVLKLGQKHRVNRFELLHRNVNLGAEPVAKVRRNMIMHNPAPSVGRGDGLSADPLSCGTGSKNCATLSATASA